ncbi:MAG: hypothetical protein PHD34_07840, partial [Methanothrix soehngenii]|nr:hypothetical protein [Methanothrix soehngenii]
IAQNTSSLFSASSERFGSAIHSTSGKIRTLGPEISTPYSRVARNLLPFKYWTMVIHISDQLHIVIMISSGGRIQPIRTEALKMFYC